jgi:hypothetical protein
MKHQGSPHRSIFMKFQNVAKNFSKWDACKINEHNEEYKGT